MTDDIRNSTFDQLLDRVLRGQAGNLDELLADNETLSAEERVRLRSMAEALGRTRIESDVAPGEETRVRDRPRRIGEYRVLRELGRGGMGVVFLAEDVALGRQAAVKILRNDIGSSAEAGERFRREAQAVARLSHPNIVTVYGAGDAAGLAYIAMEYIAGRGLDEVIEESRSAKQPPDLRANVAIARDLALALTAAHGAGIVHRDVKPSNARIAENGRAVLVDFGLAHDDALHTLTLTGTFRGSPHYASPEQVAARRIAIDYRTDIYSLGATLYEAVTGQVPFPGETKEQVFNQILVKDPTPPRRLNPAISKDLETVVLKAMEKDRDRRYASAAALENDLDALLQMRPILARRAGPLRRVLSWTRRRRGTAVAAGIAMVAVLALMASLFAQKWRSDWEHRKRIENAEQITREGSLEGAIAAWTEVASARPDDAYAQERLERVKRSLARQQADALFHEAEAALDHYTESLAALAPAFDEAPALRKKRFSQRPMTDEEVARLQEVEHLLGDLQLDAEESFFKTLELLNASERLMLEAEPRTRRLRRDLYYARLRAAQLEGATSAQTVLAGRVRELDDEGKYERLLRVPGAASFSGLDGAQVHVFRYRPHHEIVDGGDLRQVPTPLAGPPSVPPGSFCLRARTGNAVVGEGDLILSVGGWPLRDVVPVCQGGGPVRRLDRVVRIGEHPIRQLGDLLDVCRKHEAAKPPWFFLRQGTTEAIEVSWDDTLDLGIVAGSFVSLIASGETPVTLLRNDEVGEAVLPAGTAVVPTAAPAELTGSSLLGRVPFDRALDPGSYLAIVKAEGRCLLRIPFQVSPREPVVVVARWPSTRTAPQPFVPLPAARFVAGLDPLAQPIDTDALWIMDREVLGREYQQFLDDPETLKEIADSSTPIRIPRSRMMGSTQLIWVNTEGERFRIVEEALDRPICGISYHDAEAYARWRTRRARASDLPWTFSLPTDPEWEVAGRGTDGRTHPFGSYVITRWAKLQAGNPWNDPEAPYSFPIDESPYGVFDMTGSMYEWTTSSSGQARLRGSSWTSVTEATIEASLRVGLVFSPTSTSNTFGMRLVLRIGE